MKIILCLRSVTVFLALVFSALSWAGDATWIDVRTPEEFNQQHVPDALNVPYEEIDAGIAGLGLQKDDVIYLYCGTGRRAGIAKDALDKLGYTQVVNLGGLDAALAKAQGPPPK
ncbi:MAG TPA: rhodanese-like domain-containing protein [Xanthomonadales bacterium]|nr:rhodanese-like domain-containing protein [Xanthomonadales bacterium]